MQALYAASDIVVLPSWREGLSRALIEAAAMERPIITTDVPGCRDVDHGVSGLLVPLRDARGIELAVRLFMENPDAARRLQSTAESGCRIPGVTREPEHLAAVQPAAFNPGSQAPASEVVLRRCAVLLGFGCHRVVPRVVICVKSLRSWQLHCSIAVRMMPGSGRSRSRCGRGPSASCDLDLSPAGHQPMASGSGRYLIAFNGEIYNHQPCGQLQRSGALAQPWRESDTETLLAAIDAWGLDGALQRCWHVCPGPWDRQERRLHLARDPLVKSPLLGLA